MSKKGGLRRQEQDKHGQNPESAQVSTDVPAAAIPSDLRADVDEHTRRAHRLADTISAGQNLLRTRRARRWYAQNEPFRAAIDELTQPDDEASP